MRRRLFAWGVVAAGLLALAAGGRVTASDGLAPVDVVEVGGLIDEVVVHQVTRALARPSDAQAIILQLDSVGAVVSEERMGEFLDAVRGAAVPVVVWVGPTGARAFGWSAQLLAVADAAAMAPGTRVGFSGRLLDPPSGAVSFGAADAVLRARSLDHVEARERAVVRYLGDDEAVPVIRNMLLAIDGLEAKGRVLDTVTDATDDDGVAVVDATTLRFFKLDLLGQLLHTAASPPVAYLLVTIGAILLVFEFFTAGIGVAAVAGVVSGVLGTYGLAALPTRGWAVALLVASMLALAVDVQVGVPRAWTAIGLVAYGVASFSLFDPIPGSSLRPSWITLLSGIALTAVAFVAGMPSMVRTRFATPTIGRDWMVGEEGVASGPVAPEGTVELRGARWRARVNRATPLVDGQPCRVVGIDGVTLEVEPLEGGARDYREMRRRTGAG